MQSDGSIASHTTSGALRCICRSSNPFILRNVIGQVLSSCDLPPMIWIFII
jgi:hypothetical protein